MRGGREGMLACCGVGLWDDVELTYSGCHCDVFRRRLGCGVVTASELGFGD